MKLRLALIFLFERVPFFFLIAFASHRNSELDTNGITRWVIESWPEEKRAAHAKRGEEDVQVNDVRR